MPTCAGIDGLSSALSSSSARSPPEPATTATSVACARGYLQEKRISDVYENENDPNELGRNPPLQCSRSRNVCSMNTSLRLGMLRSPRTGVVDVGRMHRSKVAVRFNSLMSTVPSNRVRLYVLFDFRIKGHGVHTTKQCREISVRKSRAYGRTRTSIRSSFVPEKCTPNCRLDQQLSTFFTFQVTPKRLLVLQIGRELKSRKCRYGVK